MHLRARASGGAYIPMENKKTFDARKFGYGVIRPSSLGFVRNGMELLSRLCRGGGGESKPCIVRLSWRNVNQFT